MSAILELDNVLAAKSVAKSHHLLTRIVRSCACSEDVHFVCLMILKAYFRKLEERPVRQRYGSNSKLLTDSKCIVHEPNFLDIIHFRIKSE